MKNTERVPRIYRVCRLAHDRQWYVCDSQRNPISHGYPMRGLARLRRLHHQLADRADAKSPLQLSLI